MSKKFDAIVLGAGMAGLGTALGLARLKKRVLVVTKKNSKGDSSPAAAGILDPLLEMKPDSAFLPFCLRAFHAWGKDGIRGDYKTCGMFYAAFNAAEEKKLKQRMKWQKKFLPVSWKDRGWLLKKEPDMNPAVRGGIFYPTVGRVQPRKLLADMAAAAKKAGVHFVDAKDLPRIRVSKGKAAGVSVGKKFYEAGAVVNAAGSWAGRGIVPARGQILVLERRNLKISTILHTVNGGYIVPWDKNNLLLGSTVEFEGFKPAVTPKGRKIIRKKNEALVPALKKSREIASWAGLRPFPKDRFPLIGPSRTPGLYMAAGYYRSGILIGSYAGRLLAKGIVSGKMPAELKPFDPRRFS